MNNTFSKDQVKVPEGLKIKKNESEECSTRMENKCRRMETPGKAARGLEEDKQTLSERWKGGVYEIEAGTYRRLER